LGERLTKEGLEHPSPEPEVCLDLIKELKKETSKHMSIALLDSTKIGKLLTKANRSFKRHKRTAHGSDDLVCQWESVMQSTNTLLEEWKSAAEKESKSKSAKKTVSSSESGPPRTVAEYRDRLVSQKKDMYKDPPVLPPANMTTEDSGCSPPKGNNEKGLSFDARDPIVKAMLKDFHPNRAPEDVLRAGSFGGTYFRPISSAVTNIHYNAGEVLKETVKDEWIEGLPMNMLTSKTYHMNINKFGVKCGGSLGMWESSGWITSIDPYGWFQWYCRFYQGRRCSDDARQISRWLKSAGPKGRFRSQLCNKILAAGTSHDDKKISPVIRQTLLHWGLEITPEILEKHRKRVGK
jgi:hypothetical protein